MKIKDYIKKIKNKIYRINAFISNPFNYKRIKTPFFITKAQTYVWIEHDDNFDI